MTNAIIIPTYNGLSSLRRCLESISWAPEEGVRVVVVDSGSTDGTRQWLRRDLPWVHLLEGSNDWWWTAATYFGCQYAADTLGCEELTLLNDDNVWNREGFVALRACLAEHPGDIACSRVLFLDNPKRLLFAGGRVAWSGRIYIPGWGGPIREPTQPCELVDWCAGMGVMFRSATWRTIGGHDWEAFPHYYGDADFPLRGRRLGVRTWVCSESTMLNDKSTTGIGVPKIGATWKHLRDSLTSRKSLWNLRDASQFYRRHARWKYPIALGHVYGLHLGMSLKRIIFGKKT